MQQFSYFCKNVNCHSVDSNLGAMSSPLSQTATNLCSRPADFHSFIFVLLIEIWDYMNFIKLHTWRRVYLFSCPGQLNR